MANLNDKDNLSSEIGFISLDDTDVQNVDVMRPISAKEIEFLLSRYPFLRIFDAQADFSTIEQLPTPDLVKTKTGWIIQDYGFYMCSSPGEWLYGDYSWAETKDEEGERGGTTEFKPGQGTIIKQAFDTAAEMIALAKSHTWEVVYILEGSEIMEWAAWVIAEELNLKVEGFEATRQDQEKRDRLKRTAKLEELGFRMRLY